jgi:hypothetical protein
MASGAGKTYLAQHVMQETQPQALCLSRFEADAMAEILQPAREAIEHMFPSMFIWMWLPATCSAVPKMLA